MNNPIYIKPPPSRFTLFKQKLYKIFLLLSFIWVILNVNYMIFLASSKNNNQDSFFHDVTKDSLEKGYMGMENDVTFNLWGYMSCFPQTFKFFLLSFLSIPITYYKKLNVKKNVTKQ